MATALLDTDGPRRRVAVGQPIDLNTAGAPVWRVEDGTLDLFAVIERDGAPIGNRHFICSAHVGDILFAAAAAPIQDGDTIVSCHLRGFAGAGATVAPIDLDTLDHTQRIGAVDRWLDHFCDAVVRGHRDRESGGTSLSVDETVSLTYSTILKAARGVIWADITEGRGLLFGSEEHPCRPGWPVPLAAGSWIATDADSVIRGASSTTMLDRPDWQVELADFHARSVLILTENLLAAIAAEDERVLLSTLRSRQAYEGAIANFAAVLKKSPVATGGASLEDPLTACCRAVTHALHHKMPVKPPSKGDPPAGMVERIVRISGMPTRDVTLYGLWWEQELGPLIAFVRETDAPVALLPTRRRGYQLYNPVTGDVVALDADFAATLSPIAYSLYPTLPDRRLTLWDVLTFGLRTSGRDIGVFFAMTMIGAILALALPTAMGSLTDSLIPSHLKLQLVELGVLLIMVVATQMFVRIAGDLAQLRVFTRVSTRLQTAMMERTVRLPNAVLKRYTAADLMGRALAVDVLRQMLGPTLVGAILATVFSLTSLTYLVVMGPAMGLVAIAMFLLYVGASAWAGHAQIGALTQAEEQNAKASELSFEFIENVAHLRAAGAEERAYARWGQAYAAVQAAELKASHASSRFAAFAAGYEVFALAIFFGALQLVRSPQTSTGDLLVMIATYAQFIGSSTVVGISVQHLFLAQPKLRRARVLLDAVPEVDETKADPGELSGRIEVSHLTFGYLEGAPPVLNDVTLTIEPGQMVALVGASGCGKSTMMRLLLGFVEPQMGSIFYDGNDLKKIDLRAVRRQIGVVLQEGKLMAGSIGENILGVFGGTADQAWEAARRAGFAEDIEAMPMGMHTVLTEGGTTLSGGQAQRLLIARALVSKPRILFLDEATSALDNRTQAVVTQSLQQMAGTRIVVAHRLSTIEKADRIFVFDAGRIVQAGTYDELAHAPGYFAELVKRQME